MNLTKSLLLCGLLAGASMQAMACYTVYDRAGRVAWQGDQPPVDMSLPLHQALGARFEAGSSMVFDASTSCPSVITASRLAPARVGSTLITDQRTAQAMNVPFKPMMGGLALVEPRDARMEPGVTVLPSQTFAQARSATQSMGAGPAIIRAPGSAMITELRDQPTAVSQFSPR
ncbi:hypothetical protein [Caenimonas aquaedulcis]|uniref:DUF4124 domain-containing protein n=1 Tax=Caenimonas aquaedulcis TaxID=2793270 RepID=A0A931H0W4_9BURK|nr:hypothetical protein [Caenimonas aquaedulcis]MBG9386518.1 hypothetical protein [Caenimonas aquaedulcis]